MGMSLKRLFSELSSKELSDWELYYKLEPFSGVAQNIQLAQISCMLSNMFSSGKSMTYKPFHFMIGDEEHLAPPVRKQTPEEMLNVFKVLAK